VTIPVGVRVAEDVTVAVKVTAAPAVDGLFDETAVVELAALFTVCESAAEVLPAKFVSPPYTAVIACAPPTRANVVNAPTPPLSVPVPRAVEPSLNVTVPVGVPEPAVGFTVAVNVTPCPKADGFSEETRVTCVAGVESKLTVSIAKSVQVPTQVVRLKTTEVMLVPDWSRTPIYVASPVASLTMVEVPSEVGPLKA
jgi:hypothetical protein